MKHPKLNDAGKSVDLHDPHACTPMSTWHDANALATAIPGCELPAILNGIPFAVWGDAPPQGARAWEAFACKFDEPPFKPVPGLQRASGAVVLEPDGRVWLISPSNAFGGYTNTFPKGTLPGTSAASLRANAVREVWEETGLQVRLTGFLRDCRRSTSVCRYYLAERTGGTPADMCWESQAVHLMPRDQLAGFARHPNDRPILNALEQHWGL